MNFFFIYGPHCAMQKQVPASGLPVVLLHLNTTTQP